MVIWTPRASSDLKAIYNHIYKDSPFNAKKVAQQILKKASPLEDLPLKGKVVPEIDDSNLREVSVHSWRIIYHLRKRDIYIITVIHKRQILNTQRIEH